MSRALRVAALLATAALASPAWAQDAGHEAHGMDHAGHGVPAGDAPGDAAPPPVPADHAADRFFPADRMARARAALLDEGRFTTGAVMIDQLEYRAVSGRDGYAWTGTAWYGGDMDRIAFASEGEGAFGHRPERAETRLVWRHALNPWWNLEAGVRHDFSPSPQRTYATIGIEGLAPYWFEVEGQVFVSTRGDVHLRVGGYHDVRLAGPLVLQPDAEVNVALQDVPALGIGAGVERIELGARLRYELSPQFAPYLGIHWERKLGATADHARADGERASAVSAVAGVRVWF